MHSLPTWSELSLFVALAAGRSCFTAPCHVKSLPLPPNPLSNRGLGVLNDGRKYKIVFYLQSNAVLEKAQTALIMKDRSVVP